MEKGRVFLAWIVAAAATCAVHGPCFSAEAFTVNPVALAAVKLSLPGEKADVDYLGLSGSDTFDLGQVKATTLIISIFSMYCPHCQADAPHVNDLFKLIDGNPSLRGKVRIIGIGTGNTEFETKVFRDKFHVPFPLVPDEDLQVQKACSREIRTPVLLVVRLNEERGLKMVHTHVGPMTDARSFLKTVLDLEAQAK